MPVWLIVLIALFVVVDLLALGGFVAMRRRQDPQHYAEQLELADRALAAARADDRGWDPSAMESVARAAVAQREPGVEVRTLHLVQVVDRPGTDDDEARFLVNGEHEVQLGRRNGAWLAL